MRSDFLIDFINMFLFHVCRFCSAFFLIVDFGFVSLSIDEVSFIYCLALALTVTKLGPLATTKICLDLAESQGYSPMSEL